jgi:hypothetical protein
MQNNKQFIVISLTDKQSVTEHRQKFPYLFCVEKSVVSNLYETV